MLGLTGASQQNGLIHINGDTIHAKKRLWHVQTQYRRYSDAQLRHTRDIVSHEDVVSVKVTIFDQRHKLAPVTNVPFFAVAVDIHIATIKSFDKSVKRYLLSMLRKCCSQTNTKFQLSPLLLVILLGF